MDRTLDTLDCLDGLLQKIQGTPDHVFNLTEYFLLRFQCAYRLDDSESLNRTIRLLDELPSDRFTKEQAWRYQSSRAAVALDEDDFETFWQWIHRCETHAMQSIDPLIKFQTSLLKGTAETRAGRFSEGELLLRSTESFFWESGFYTFFCDALLQLGLNLYYQGRHQESIDTFHRLIRSDFRNQVPVSYILAEAGCARVYNDQGKTGEALDHVEQGLGIRLPSPFFFGEGLLWLEKARSLILSGKGDPSRAIQCAQKALKCLEPLRSEDYCISLILQADLQMGSGDADESKALLDRAVLEIERLKSPAGKVRAWMALAGTYASLTASGRSDTEISLRETLGKIISLSDNLKTPHSRYEIETLLERYGLKDDFKQHLGVLTRGPVMHQDHGVIEVNICGRFEVRLPGTQDLLPRKTWGSDKSRMLFHALILAGQDNAGQTRESLGARIWPEISQERLPNAFHIALSHVRKAIDPLGHALEFKNGRYRLNPEFFQVDAWIIQSELKKAFKFDRAGQPHLACEARKKAAGLYLGDILPDRYEEWIDQTRAHLRLEIRHAMMWLIRRYHELGLTYDVISTAQQLIEIDPADEDAHRYLIESMNAAGDRSGAIRQYQRLIRILKSELEVEPDPTTVQLMSKIMVSD